MIWGLLDVVLVVAVLSVLGGIIAIIEPVWRFWTWLIGTVLTHGKGVIIVTVLVLWFDQSERVGSALRSLWALVNKQT